MKQRSSKTLFTCGILAFCLVSCSTTVSPTNAKLVGNRYENRFFNFQLQIPLGWVVGNKQDFETAVATIDTGRKSKMEHEEIEKISHLLLLISETPTGTPADSNPVVVLMAVDRSGEPNIRTAKDYQQLVAQQIVAQSHWTQIGDPLPVRLGSKEFYRVDFELEVVGHPLHEASFATFEKRYILILNVTADSEADVEKILALIDFTPGE